MKAAEIRPAHPGDIDRMHSIKRESFPDYLKLRLPLRYWRRWWNFVILSPTAEAYVVVVDGTVAGFAVMVTDEENFRQGVKSIKPSVIDYAFLLLSSLKQVSLLFKKGTLRARSLASENPVQANPVRHSDDFANRTWLEEWAISRKYRGRGLARMFLEYIERRATSLKHGNVSLMVQQHNRLAKSIYERSGYVPVSQTPGYAFYRKELTEDGAAGE